MSKWHTIDKEVLEREIARLDALFTAIVGYPPEKASGQPLGNMSEAMQAIRFIATRDALVFVVNSLSGEEE